METPVAVAGWPNQAETFLSLINSYRSKDMFCDCTLACDRKFFRAHKMVLSMCSEFFENIFSNAQDKNPVIILNEVEAWQLECLLNYMYKGETSVPETLFSSLCRVARCLQIKGFDMVELHRKAVKLSKHRESRSLERTQQSDSSYNKYNSSGYLSNSRRGNGDYLNKNEDDSCFFMKTSSSHDYKHHFDRSSPGERSAPPALPLLREGNHTKSDHTQYDDDDYGYNYDALCDERRPSFSHQSRKISRSLRTNHSVSENKLNAWVKSESDTFCSKSNSDNLKSSPSSHHSAQTPPHTPYNLLSISNKESGFCQEENGKRGKESDNQIPTRRSPPGLLPSKGMEIRRVGISPVEHCSSRSTNESKKSEAHTLAQQRGPPPLLKLITNIDDSSEAALDEDYILPETFRRNFTSDQSHALKANCHHKPIPYLEPVSKARRSSDDIKALQEALIQSCPASTSISQRYLDRPMSKSESPPHSRGMESPLNLSNEKNIDQTTLSSGTVDDPLLKKIQTNKRKRVRGPKSWEFLLRLLRDPISNPSLIRWEDESNGIFRLIRPEIIAQRWGRRTGKHGSDILSYESFARGLRYHYATGALTAVSEKSFVYQFGPKAQKALHTSEKISDNVNFDI